MRQFILAKNVAYASGSNLNAVADGAVGVFYDNNGVLTATTTGTEDFKEAMLVLGRPVAKGGPVVLPIHKNKFSYVKGVYDAARTFTAKVTVDAPTRVGDYTIIVVRKGVGFNERNKWTASVHVTDTSMTAAVLAGKLKDAIEANSSSSGVTVSVEGSAITITAAKAGVDYEILGADLLIGIEATDVTAGTPAYGDAAYIKDLAAKAAADAGFEYTYRDAVVDLYPNYPLDPLAQANAADAGYTIFTLRFAEPRVTKPLDEVVNQVVQVAFPTGASGIATFETVCKGLAGVVESADSEE